MKLKEASPNKLENKTDRATARLAMKARANTYFGGASALVIAKRADKMKFIKFPAMDIVSDIYSKSNESLGEYGAYECPECGNICLGETKALECCADRFLNDLNESPESVFA